MDIVSYFPTLFHSIVLTLQLLACALGIGLTLAMGLTFLGLSEHACLRWPVHAYIFVIRGTPLLIQIFLIYYGSSQFDALRESFLWPLFKEPFACATIALALNTAAYTTVLFMGAVSAIPPGERDACAALGMSRSVMLGRILLPRALRIALPAYSNEVIMVFQSTSLASTITLLDILGTTQQLNAETYMPITFFMIAGCIYLTFNGIFTALFRWFEHRYPPIPRRVNRKPLTTTL